MKTEELALFNAADWGAIRTALIRYAEMKCFNKSIRSVSELPEGKEPADIALIAIQKTLEWICTGTEGTGSRKWNRQLNPELIDHLKDAVDSEISNLINKKEHLSTNYSASVDEETAAEIFQSSIDEAAPSRQTPEDAFQSLQAAPDDAELLDIYLLEVYAVLNERKDEEATLVLMSFEEQAKGDGIPKHQIIAEQTGMKIETVRNAVKRIRTAAIMVKEKVIGRMTNEQ